MLTFRFFRSVGLIFIGYLCTLTEVVGAVDCGSINDFEQCEATKNCRWVGEPSYYCTVDGGIKQDVVRLQLPGGSQQIRPGNVGSLVVANSIRVGGFGAQLASPVFDGNLLIVPVKGPDRLVAFDAERGWQQAWQYERRGDPYEIPSHDQQRKGAVWAIPHRSQSRQLSDKVIFRQSDGSVVAVQSTTGRELWTNSPRNEMQNQLLSIDPILVGDRVVLADFSIPNRHRSCTLRKVDLLTGRNVRPSIVANDNNSTSPSLDCHWKHLVYDPEFESLVTVTSVEPIGHNTIRTSVAIRDASTGTAKSISHFTTPKSTNVHARWRNKISFWKSRIEGRNFNVIQYHDPAGEIHYFDRPTGRVIDIPNQIQTFLRNTSQYRLEDSATRRQIPDFSRAPQPDILAWKPKSGSISWTRTDQLTTNESVYRTRTDLTFFGTTDGKVIAVRSGDGTELFRFNLSGGVAKRITSFEVRGRQHIAVLVSQTCPRGTEGHGNCNGIRHYTTLGTKLLLFALP